MQDAGVCHHQPFLLQLFIAVISVHINTGTALKQACMVVHCSALTAMPTSCMARLCNVCHHPVSLTCRAVKGAAADCSIQLRWVTTVSRANAEHQHPSVEQQHERVNVMSRQCAAELAAWTLCSCSGGRFAAVDDVAA